MTDVGRQGDEGDRLFRRHYARMAEQLRQRGFAVVVVDYLSAEGVANTCSGEIRHETVGQYITAALDYARDLPNTDPDRLFVIGWSHGGAGVIAWLQTLGSSERPAAGAVAVYPQCESREPWVSSLPVLVLLGGADDIALPEVCDQLEERLPEGTEARFSTYPDGRHGFDMTEGPEVLDLGGITIGRHPESGSAAWSEIFEFLNAGDG